MTNQDGFNREQQAYLQGLLMGTDVARAVRGLPILSGSAGNGSNAQTNHSSHLPKIHRDAQQRQEAEGKQLCSEEKAKRDKNALEMWSEIESRSEAGEFPKGNDVFLSKYHGLFFVAPAQQSYMCRMRLPGGVLSSAQLHGVANIAENCAGGYLDVTTRANLQLREIPASRGFDVLLGLRDLGIVTLGAGADNIRNVTCSPLSGLDPTELLETLPLAKRMHYHILHCREMYGLPRKFNIAFDGGGAISALAETNDISFHAVTINASQATPNLPVGVYLQLGLGGISGHGDFARGTGVLVLPKECTAIAEAIVAVFNRLGDRTDRKKARLKYVLDRLGFDDFLREVETAYGKPLRRLSVPARSVDQVDRWAHVDVHPQKQAGLFYVGVSLEVGRMSSVQARGIASIAQRFGGSEVRLTVWQNLLIPNIPAVNLAQVRSALLDLGIDWRASSFRAGLVACTGNAGCKFAASNTKSHANQIADHLESRLVIDRPINIHVTGCHHSCAQHAISDIGLLATKVEVEEDMVEGYHIYVGGSTGEHCEIGQKAMDSVPFEQVPSVVESLVRGYLRQRKSAEESLAACYRRVGLDGMREQLDVTEVARFQDQVLQVPVSGLLG